MGPMIRKTWTVGNGLVLPPKTRHFKVTILATIKYLSSDHIMTWSVCTLCSFSHSFISRCQIWDKTNIHWVTFKNPGCSGKISCYLTPIGRILVRSQIWHRKVEERLKLHNLHTDHFMICWDLRYLIGAKVAATVKCNRGPGTTQPKHCCFMTGPGNNPTNTKPVAVLAWSRTELNHFAGPNPNCWRVTRTHC